MLKQMMVATLAAMMCLGMAHANPSSPIGYDAASSPNVVIIYGDDVGFGDVGVERERARSKHDRHLQ